MVRHLLLAVPVVAALGWAAAAAPVPADAVGLPPFPTTAGTTWVYRQEDGQEWTETITAAKVDRNGTTTLTVEKKHRRAGGWAESWQLEVNRWGVYWMDLPRPDAEPDTGPPRCLLRLPAEPGAEWVYARPTGVARMRQLAPERVSVPAGTFRAVPVTVALQAVNPTAIDESPPLPMTLWYAPGVGLVRRSAPDSEVVLVSFTPGR